MCGFLAHYFSKPGFSWQHALPSFLLYLLLRRPFFLPLCSLDFLLPDACTVSLLRPQSGAPSLFAPRSLPRLISSVFMPSITIRSLATPKFDLSPDVLWAPHLYIQLPVWYHLLVLRSYLILSMSQTGWRSLPLSPRPLILSQRMSPSSIQLYKPENMKLSPYP